MICRPRWRKLVNALMFTITGMCAIAAVSVLFWILGYLVWNGGKALNLDFFVRLPKPPGEAGGGMANALLGSTKILIIAACLGVPVGVLGGAYLAEFGGTTFPFLIRYAADLLNGIPSIVIGIFTYSVIVLSTHRFSALAGGAALSLILIPLIMRSTEEFFRAVPQTLREGALALGANKRQVVLTVVMPASLRGVITGVLLGIARIAGETAPLLFTSFNNRYWSNGLGEPTASMPVIIFAYAISPYPDWRRQAWAGGLVLLAVMLLSNLCIRLVLGRGISRQI